jgi:hypothetical protein
MKTGHKYTTMCVLCPIKWVHSIQELFMSVIYVTNRHVAAIAFFKIKMYLNIYIYTWSYLFELIFVCVIWY